MTPPLVSVAMVTRNVERFLPEAIESILNQTFTDLEFVIVDFGSTDASKSIISSYQLKDHRIKLHEIPSCTLSEARNVSCSLSTGRYIAIMDADDVALPHRLECQLEFLEKHPEVGVVGGDTEWIDRTGAVLRTQHHPRGDSEIRETLLSASPFCNPSVVVRREVFLATGGFRNVPPAEDYDLWLRAAEHCKMANLPRILLRYRIHPHQESQRNVRQMTLCALAARAAADLRMSGKPDPLNSVGEITSGLLLTMGVSEAAWQNALATQYRLAIGRMSQTGEYSDGLKLAAEMLNLSDWKHVARWQVADVWFARAWFYWRKREILRSVMAAGRAVLIRPIVVLRPLKLLLRRLRQLPNPQVGPWAREAK